MTEVAEDLSTLKKAETQEDLYLTFCLGNENYGIEIFYVIEIVGMQRITELPDMPCYIKGVVNLRGHIIPVMDVRLRFNMPERPYDDRTCLIVTRIAETTTGLVVDRVNEVSQIQDGQIEAAPLRHRDDQAQFIRGLGKVGDEVKILLDIQQLLGESSPTEDEEA
ncbi:MAG: purine-binding chemotaxis protein CheW [Desulfuromonadaceae bacterium]|nr:purine-binding chemotaxis protein CheW [Desulfuromonadaceae bacterium]